MRSRILLLLILLYPVSAFSEENEALNHFHEKLAQIEPTKEAVLKAFGKPQTKYQEPIPLQQNLQVALRLAPTKEERYLLDSELHPRVLQKGDVKINDLDQPEVMSQISELWTYDYEGKGKWASFIGVYFNAKGELIGWDWQIPKEEPEETIQTEFFEIRSKPQTFFEHVGTALSWPFNLVRGIKQSCIEVVKAPFNFLEVTWFLGPKDGWAAAQQDLLAAKAMLEYTAFNRSNQDLLTSIQNLFAEIPLIGSWLDQPLPREIPSQCDAYFLIGGIHQISDHAQRMDPLERFLKERLKTDRVYQIPWNHGTLLDVSFGTLNLSTGDGLLIAQKIVSQGNLKKGDRIALFAHSGAIQQIIGAARILRDEGIYVTQAFGVAGVFLGGEAPVRIFEIVYNPDQDRFKNIFGFRTLTPSIRWSKVSGTEPNKAHELSGSLDKQTRLFYDGYFEEIATFFEQHQR